MSVFFNTIPNFMASDDIVKELERARFIQKKMEEKYGMDGGPYNNELLMLDHRIKHLREEAVRRGLEE